MKKYGTAGQAADNNIIQCMLTACLISKATNRHSEYVILFHGSSGYAKVPRCYFHAYVVCLVYF